MNALKARRDGEHLTTLEFRTLTLRLIPSAAFDSARLYPEA
jgi:hypothetical protein